MDYNRPWKLIEIMGESSVYDKNGAQILNYRDPVPQAKAYARLITAVPDLLDACIAAIPIIGRDLNPTDNPAFAVLKLLRDAIAKAGGNS